MSSTITALTSGGGLAMAGDTSGQLELKTNNGTTAVTINTAQGAQFLNTIGVGNATPSTSGAGITFPATQSASSDANTLDDYEEGTWTPTVVSGGGSITSYTSTGTYTKIGNIVTVAYIFQITNAGTASGTATITNLPFQVAFNSSLDYTGSCRETFNSGLWYFGIAQSGTNQSTIWTSTNGGISWATNSRYTISLTYRVA
jgi:hypothetical protein